MRVICGLAHEPRKYMDTAALEEMTASVGKIDDIDFPSFLRGGAGHADRVDERPEGDPGAGHHPGGEEQEEAGVNSSASAGRPRPTACCGELQSAESAEQKAKLK